MFRDYGTHISWTRIKVYHIPVRWRQLPQVSKNTHDPKTRVIIYTQTKKFSNTSQMRISITEIHLEINTNLHGFFGSKCDYKLIQYQILQNFICMERSACHKMFLKKQHVNILNFLHVHRRQIRTVSAETHVPETLLTCYTKRVCCKKCHSSWCDVNKTFLRWS